METTTKKKSKIWKYIGWFVAFIILLNIVTRLDLSSDKEKKKVVEKKVVTKSLLFYIAKEAVTQNLKSPTSAEFPYDDEASYVGGLTDSIYSVTSYVDSQNSFGAMLRSNYRVKMKYVGGEVDKFNSYRVIDVIIQ